MLSPESEDLRVMCISLEAGVVSIELTPFGLQQLREAVVCWHDGAEDFQVSPPQDRRSRFSLGDKDLASGELWFWGPYYYSP